MSKPDNISTQDHGHRLHRSWEIAVALASKGHDLEELMLVLYPTTWNTFKGIRPKRDCHIHSFDEDHELGKL